MIIINIYLNKNMMKKRICWTLCLEAYARILADEKDKKISQILAITIPTENLMVIHIEVVNDNITDAKCPKLNAIFRLKSYEKIELWLLSKSARVLRNTPSTLLKNAFYLVFLRKTKPFASV